MGRREPDPDGDGGVIDRFTIQSGRCFLFLSMRFIVDYRRISFAIWVVIVSCELPLDKFIASYVNQTHHRLARIWSIMYLDRLVVVVYWRLLSCFHLVSHIVSTMFSTFILIGVSSLDILALVGLSQRASSPISALFHPVWSE